MAKRIVREPEACDRLGCKRTKFREDYRLNDPAEPFVPDSEIPRLKPVPLGTRNLGFLDHEIDQLIDALAKLRDTAPAVTRAAPVRTRAKASQQRRKRK
jgi:predicted DNA-binding transcriptional regulator AlpA